MLWLWHRPVATAPIRLLAWEPPYDKGPKKQKKKKDETREVIRIRGCRALEVRALEIWGLNFFRKSNAKLEGILAGK